MTDLLGFTFYRTLGCLPELGIEGPGLQDTDCLLELIGPYRRGSWPTGHCQSWAVEGPGLQDTGLPELAWAVDL